VIIPDQLVSSAAAKKEIMASVQHRQHKGLNKRTERSHQPARQPERTMRRFKSPGHTQRVLCAFGPLLDHIRPKRHRLAAEDDHALMRDRFLVCNKVTSGKTAVLDRLLPSYPPLLSSPSFYSSKKLFYFLAELTIPINEFLRRGAHIIVWV
jgi:hypothetical protein